MISPTICTRPEWTRALSGFCLAAWPIRGDGFRMRATLLEAMETDAPPPDWHIPEGCVDVGPLVREYLESQNR